MVLLRCTADPQNTVSRLKKCISAVSGRVGLGTEWVGSGYVILFENPQKVENNKKIIEALIQEHCE